MSGDSPVRNVQWRPPVIRIDKQPTIISDDSDDDMPTTSVTRKPVLVDSDEESDSIVNVKHKKRRLHLSESEEENSPQAVPHSVESSENEDAVLHSPSSKLALSFFNFCDESELIAWGCSEEHVSLIVKKRPFPSLSHVSETLYSIGIADFYADYMDARHAMAALDEIICESYVDDVQHNTSIEIDSRLKHYQVEGVEWLLKMHRTSSGCILADEMGLGKTVQVICFLKEIQDKGPHMLVVPGSCLENWMREFATWASHLNILVYHGNQNERTEIREYFDRSSFDVLLTTYNVACGSKYDVSYLKRLKFHCLILDEGHMIKNLESARYKTLNDYKTPFRLLMTGTPLQNNLKELMVRVD